MFQKYDFSTAVYYWRLFSVGLDDEIKSQIIAPWTAENLPYLRDENFAPKVHIHSYSYL